MLIEKGGAQIQNTIVLPGQVIDSGGPAGVPTARVTLRVEWPTHESPLVDPALIVDLLQEAIIKTVPTAYQEVEARLTDKEKNRA